jgi:hypothetical protein
MGPGQVLLHGLNLIENRAAIAKRDPTPDEYRRLIKTWADDATAYSTLQAEEAALKARMEVLGEHRRWRGRATLVLLIALASGLILVFGGKL